MGAPTAGSLRVRFWGVRGTLPAPGPDTCRYGGNTSCVEVRAGDQILIFDAGTGLRKLGLELQRQSNGRPVAAAIFLSHTHWDHIHGLPYFAPAFVSGNRFQVYGCPGAPKALESIIAGQMESPYFPLPMSALPGTFEFHEPTTSEIRVNGVRVTTHPLNHPGSALAFRVDYRGRSVVYATDNEPCSAENPAANHGPDSPCARGDHAAALSAFARDTDLLIIDAQYTSEEYLEHVGFGHGSHQSAIALALTAGARRLALFHHDPERSDKQLDAIVAEVRTRLAERGAPLECFAAKEGATVTL